MHFGICFRIKIQTDTTVRNTVRPFVFRIVCMSEYIHTHIWNKLLYEFQSITEKSSLFDQIDLSDHALIILNENIRSS